METTHQTLTQIMNLDLSKVKFRLINPQKHGMSGQSADDAINAFKRFFFLAGVEGPPLVPTKEIDDVWHEFLMFTLDYEKTCRTLFGKFIHHEPSMGTPEETTLMKNAFKRTQELHQKHFNQPYITAYGDCCSGDSCHTCHDQSCCSTDDGGGGM
jgi:hypothetical protein